MNRIPQINVQYNLNNKREKNSTVIAEFKLNRVCVSVKHLEVKFLFLTYYYLYHFSKIAGNYLCEQWFAKRQSSVVNHCGHLSLFNTLYFI